MFSIRPSAEPSCARAVRCALGALTVAGAVCLPLSAHAFAAPTSPAPMYWWPAQVSGDQKALTVIYDSRCSAGTPRALVQETAASITIELLATHGMPCAAPPAFGQLSVSLRHRVAGRPVVGSRADPGLAGSEPSSDVAGRTAAGSLRAPRVVGLNAMDAKLALRMAGLTPHASSSSLTAEVTKERQLTPAPRKVLLATRPHRQASVGGTGSLLGAATPALEASPSPPLASAPPAVCANADLAPTSANLNAVGTAALCLVNQQRVQASLTALVGDEHLQLAAEQHSLDMTVNHYFSHTTPAGESFSTRLLASDFTVAGAGFQLGENLAWGTRSLSTPASIVSAWMNSPDHRANILNPGYRQTGMGIVAVAPAVDPNTPGATYTQEFGAVG
jgi:uncharacterized protein YkwD